MVRILEIVSYFSYSVFRIGMEIKWKIRRVHEKPRRENKDRHTNLVGNQFVRFLVKYTT